MCVCVCVYVCVCVSVCVSLPVFPVQKEEERLRAAVRRENQQKRVRERHSQRGLTASYIEPDREVDIYIRWRDGYIGGEGTYVGW